MGVPHSDLRKIDSHLSDTISRIIENKNLLYQIHDCCTAEYNNADFETSYEDFFLNKKRKTIMSPQKMEQLNLMMLYNSLSDFVNEYRIENHIA